ncbi:hypothetical protein F5887DRAFT_1284984 [Amanita rubescens]|nr:hypothetical protein F5887DRAFT_1284984 [Amanita rubescens]
MATFDYSSFLPGNLDPALQELTNVYKNNTDRLTNAFFQTPLPGVHTSAPDITGAKDLGFKVALRSVPSVRDVVAYTQLIATFIPVITDHDTLVAILLPNASSWKILETSDLSDINEEYRQKFNDYLPILDPMVDGLNNFLTELKNIDKENPPAWFKQTLFDTLTPILSFASFRPGVEGQSILAGILGLSISMVNTPLNEILFPLFPLSPDPKVVIAEAVQTNCVDAITKYEELIRDLIPLFEPFQAACITVSEEQVAVAPRIKDNAPGPEPTTADQCILAWDDVKNAGNGFINYVAGGSSANAASTETSKSPAAQAEPISPGDVTKAF